MDESLSPQDTTSIADILEFWFGELDGDWCSDSRDQLWWYENTEIDAKITNQFGQRLKAASSGLLDHWSQIARGWLALIILFDQFSRNIHRRKKLAFVNDEFAVRLTRVGLELGHEKELKLIERVFFLAPLMHREEHTTQQFSLQCYEELYALTANEDKSKAQRYVDAAKLHLQLIQRFRRFPHRNALLKRTSTPEEQTYLSGAHESFGQG